MLAEVVREVTIVVFFPQALALEKLPQPASLIRFLRAPQLEKAAILGLPRFLLAVRSARALRHLSVSMVYSAHRSLVSTLRQLGSGLSKLDLSCVVKDVSDYNLPPPKCPMSLFHADGWNELITSCPNLKHLHICCYHLAPSRVSLLISRLPSLTSMSLSSPAQYEMWELSEEDIAALRGLENVSLDNVSGGMRVVSRVGAPVTSVTYIHEDEACVTGEIANCPRVSQATIQMKYSELPNCKNVLPQLPPLTSLTVLLEIGVFFDNVKGAVIQVIHILRIDSHPLKQITLKSRVTRFEWISRKKEMTRIRRTALRHGAFLTYEELRSGSGSIDCKINLVEG